MGFDRSALLNDAEKAYALHGGSSQSPRSPAGAVTLFKGAEKTYTLHGGSLRSPNSPAGAVKAIPDVPSKAALSVRGAVLTLVAGAIGPGLLALPSVMGTSGEPRAGYIGGAVLLIIAGIGQWFANCCISAAIDAGEERCSSMGRCESLDGLARRSVNGPGQAAASILANATTLGCATSDIIVLGVSLARVTGWRERASVALVGALLSPLTLVKFNAALSSVGVTACSLALPIVAISASWSAHAESWSAIGPTEQLGPAFCLVVFPVGFGFLVPGVKARMENPRLMPRASGIALLILLTVYGFIMGISYFAWGNNVAGNVLDSLVPVPLANIATLLLCVNVMIGYSMMMQCTTAGLSESAGIQEGCWKNVLRIGAAMLTTVVATFLPCFNEFIAVVSAITVVACNYIIPPVCYWTLRAREQGSLVQSAKQERCRSVVHILVLLGGIVAAFFGVKVGMQNLDVALHKLRH